MLFSELPVALSQKEMESNYSLRKEICCKKYLFRSRRNGSNLPKAADLLMKNGIRKLSGYHEVISGGKF